MAGGALGASPEECRRGSEGIRATRQFAGEDLSRASGLLLVERMAKAMQVDDMVTVEQRPKEATEFAAGGSLRCLPDDFRDPVEGGLGGVSAFEAAVDCLL